MAYRPTLRLPHLLDAPQAIRQSLAFAYAGPPVLGTEAELNAEYVQGGLKAWWKLNTLTGNDPDSAGSSVAMVPVGAVRRGFDGTRGEPVGCCRFVSSGYFEQASNNTLHDLGTSNFAIAVWVRCQPTYNGIVVGKFDGAHGTATSGYCLSIASDGTIVFTTNGHTVSTASNIADSQWHHIVVVLDRDNVHAEIWVDGAFITQGVSDSTASNLLVNTGKLRIGYGSDDTNAFQGDLAHVALFKGLATGMMRGRIQDLYRAGIGPVNTCAYSPDGPPDLGLNTVALPRLYKSHGLMGMDLRSQNGFTVALICTVSYTLPANAVGGDYWVVAAQQGYAGWILAVTSGKVWAGEVSDASAVTTVAQSWGTVAPQRLRIYFRHDAQNGQFSIGVNGNAHTSTSATSWTFLSELFVHGQPATSAFSHGVANLILIFNRTLTQSEVKQLDTVLSTQTYS